MADLVRLGPKLPGIRKARTPGQEALRREVCASGMTQAQVAERYGIPIRTLSTWLNGEVPTRSADLLEELRAHNARRGRQAA